MILARLVCRASVIGRVGRALALELALAEGARQREAVVEGAVDWSQQNAPTIAESVRQQSDTPHRLLHSREFQSRH